MKFYFVLSLLLILNINGLSQVKIGDKYGGIIKLTIIAAKNNINGKWNAGDHTGNTAIDATLNKYESVNKTNPKAIAALENAAAEVKFNPEKFVNPDGSVNKHALNALISEKFAGVGEVTLPSNSVLLDSNTNKNSRNR